MSRKNSKKLKKEGSPNGLPSQLSHFSFDKTFLTLVLVNETAHFLIEFFL